MLEAPRAWLLTFVYVVTTVTLATPLVCGAAGALLGLDAATSPGWAVTLARFGDALLYAFFPQV